MAFVNARVTVQAFQPISRWGLSIAFSAVLMFLLCKHFDPHWETNDDVAMSMVAHGYGIAAFGSPNLVFSNVLWGYVVRFLPTVSGVLGYSIATLLALFAASCSIIYFLMRLGSASWISMITACLLLCRPIVFPQFTLTSGLLAISGVLGLITYLETRSFPSLIGAALLAFFSFLIRSQELWFVMAVASPALVRRRLYRDVLALRIVGILLVAILAAGIWDHFCYSGAPWQRFMQLDAARAPFTDFGIAQRIANDPHMLKRFGYSRNDAELLGSFFFVDPTIFIPVKLHAMVSSVGAVRFVAGNGSGAMHSIEALLSPEIVPLVVLGAVLFAIVPSVEVACGWLLLFLALLVMGFVGRGGLLRVDFPAVSMLCLISIVSLQTRLDRTRASVKKALGVCGVIASLAWTLFVLYPQAKREIEHTAAVQAAAAKFPNDVVVVWGTGLEFESLFPLLSDDWKLRGMKIFSLGVFTHAPFSVSAVQEATGHGFISSIRSDKGLLMVAVPNVELLRVWCRERFGGVLQGAIVQAPPYVHIDRLWCKNS